MAAFIAAAPSLSPRLKPTPRANTTVPCRAPATTICSARPADPVSRRSVLGLGIAAAAAAALGAAAPANAFGLPSLKDLPLPKIPSLPSLPDGDGVKTVAPGITGMEVEDVEKADALEQRLAAKAKARKSTAAKSQAQAE
jgi:hypothetical protein